MNNKKSSKISLDKFKNLTDTSLLLTITIVVFFLMYLSAMIFLGKGFLKPQTFCNILFDNASLIVLSVGMSIVMIAGGIDISVGAVAGLVSMCCAVYLEKQNGNLIISFIIAIAIGLLFGLVQGYLVAYLNIQPFIVTLAGMFFARGMTTIVNSEPFNIEKCQAFTNLKNIQIKLPFIGSYNKNGDFNNATISVGVVVALLVVIIFFCILKWTKLGRSFYAVGGNAQSALMLGINVKKTKFLSHLLCGLLAGIGGYVYFMYSGKGSPDAAATGAEMNAIASSIIGGTMLTGGVGNIIGTLFGVLSLSTIQLIVASAGFDEAWWTGITVAVMLCIFLVVQSIVLARKKNEN